MSADLGTRMLAYHKTLRDANESARPTQKLDTTTLRALDVAVKRNADADARDLNSVLHRSLP